MTVLVVTAYSFLIAVGLAGSFTACYFLPAHGRRNPTEIDCLRPDIFLIRARTALNILLTGASGFIGKRLMAALQAKGHRVICTVRRSSRAIEMKNVETIPVDFVQDSDPSVWVPRLAGIDVLINTVGIIRERGTQNFTAIHVRTPCALFRACELAGVGRVIQISALGADRDARSRYHLSKRDADDYLASLPLRSVIVQPSLVYGPGGASARLFNILASLPVIGLPGGGRQRVQPVYINDLIDGIVALLDAKISPGVRLPMVGPAQVTMRSFLEQLRSAMHLSPGRFLTVPNTLASLAAVIGEKVPASLLDRENLQMLERGNTGDPTPLRRLIGREARPVESFIAGHEAATVRINAQLGWLLPLLRLSIALVWIVTGIVSLGLYPVAESYALLARVGIDGWMAPFMLYGAALLDLAFGFATLLMKRRHWLWWAQLATILFYTIVITFRLPEFWLHPYGPLLKNLPMLAAIWLLLELEKPAWTTSR